MKSRAVNFVLIVCCGMLSCSPHDSEADRRAKDFASTHPHPFELTATDSSIIGRYVWEDTLREYSMGCSMPNENGVHELLPSQGNPVPVPLVHGGVYEWTFDALGLQRLTDGRIIHFGRSAPETEFGYAWKYDGGKFDPIFIR